MRPLANNKNRIRIAFDGGIFVLMVSPVTSISNKVLFFGLAYDYSYDDDHEHHA
jgi:hypothetical protein